ncbi:MAG: glutamate-5-semialdehyde dehydrogenase [Culicoidibacterales bacterium]
MRYIEILGKNAKRASQELARVSQLQKEEFLLGLARTLEQCAAAIEEVNAEEVKIAEKKGQNSAYIDRMRLTKERIFSMAEGVREIAVFPDPIGKIETGWVHPDGLEIICKRVPLGVVGMIYESRPNVTIDVACLALKSGNALILRGGSDTIKTNMFLVQIIAAVGQKYGLPENAVQIVAKVERGYVRKLLQLSEYIDVIIPRGGRNLKQEVLAHACVPVIETGAGVCHMFVDASADVEMAIRLIVNAKTQRPGTCNSVETVLIARQIMPQFCPRLEAAMKSEGVELIVGRDTDYSVEYLDKKLALKCVENVEEAIVHINQYGTKHSDAIITSNMSNATKFTQEVDSACVYVNASTRYTDGGQFGFGGEVGISTQKLHVRGPMGVNALTTTKYVILGTGQSRK